LEDVCTGDFLPLGAPLGDSTLCGATNNFDLGMGNSCTGKETPGPDLQFTFQIVEGDAPCVLDVRLFYCADSTPFDGALYLVLDCANYGATCIIGSDNEGVGVEESFFVQILPRQDYTLIIDSRNALCGRFGLYMVAYCFGEPSATERRSWGAVKSLYR